MILWLASLPAQVHIFQQWVRNNSILSTKIIVMRISMMTTSYNNKSKLLGSISMIFTEIELDKATTDSYSMNLFLCSYLLSKP